MIARICVALAVLASVGHLHAGDGRTIDQDRGLIVCVFAACAIVAVLPAWVRLLRDGPGVLYLAGGAATVSVLLSAIAGASIVIMGSRGEGVAFQVAAPALALALLLSLENRGQVDRLIHGLIILALVIAAYAVAQLTGHDPLRWAQIQNANSATLTSQAFALFGNTAYLRSWLVMVLPVAWIAAHIKGWVPAAPAWALAFSVLVAFVHAPATSIAVRLDAWRQFVRWPSLMGIGPEQLQSLGVTVAAESGAVWDRTHNAVLDVALTQGWLGLVAMAILIVVAARTCWQLRKDPLGLGLSLGLLLHLLDGLVSPQPVATELLAWLYLAVVQWMAWQAPTGDVATFKAASTSRPTTASTNSAAPSWHGFVLNITNGRSA